MTRVADDDGTVLDATSRWRIGRYRSCMSRQVEELASMHAIGTMAGGFPSYCEGSQRRVPPLRKSVWIQS
jgi:hypothetical protein